MTAKDFAQYHFEGAWHSFEPGKWSNDEVDVRDFIQRNYTPYTGDESFLATATERTKKLNDKYLALRQEELQKGGVLDIDTETVSSLRRCGAGRGTERFHRGVFCQVKIPGWGCGR